MKNGLLDEIARKNKRYISDLRLFPDLKWHALAQLHALKGKEQYPLAEWSEAVSYLLGCTVPFPVSWTVKMKKKQKETQDILSYHSQAAGCSDKARAKASGGRQPIEECGRTGL